MRYVTGMRERTRVREKKSYKSNNFFFKSPIGFGFIHGLEYTLVYIRSMVVLDTKENVLERLLTK